MSWPKRPRDNRTPPGQRSAGSASAASTSGSRRSGSARPTGSTPRADPMLDDLGVGSAPEIAPPDEENLAARLVALAELPLPQLKLAWASSWGSPPPKGARRRFLMLGIAWRWQAQVHGGFSRATERRLTALEATFRQSRRIETAQDRDGGAEPGSSPDARIPARQGVAWRTPLSPCDRGRLYLVWTNPCLAFGHRPHHHGRPA